MRAALVLKGGNRWPDQAKARRMGADRIGWEIDDQQIDPALNGGVNVIEPVRGNNFTLFMFRALWGWSGSPEGWADEFKKGMGRLDLLKSDSHPARQCALDADLEVDDSDWLRRALGRCLEIMPGRGLTWSMQPHKGGIISDGLVDFINNQRWLTVAPFAYRNNMDRCSERWVVDDLLARGIRREKILIYYRDHCEGWDGFLWDLNQIQ